jgi:PHD/YefM family antitoxin component YafN of YafNO toxin-antitoxin module
MNILKKAIVSNSDIIKNYKSCREKAEELGRIFVLKNNQPDAVLFSIEEYERFSLFIEYLESFEASDIKKFSESLPKARPREKHLIDILKHDIL